MPSSSRSRATSPAASAAIPVGTKVGLDAPHGSFVLPDDKPGGPLLLAAGGVGIAPILGILRELAATGDRRPVRLIYAGARPQAMIAPERIVAEGGGLDFAAVFLAEEAGADWPYGRGRVTAETVADGARRPRSAAMSRRCCAGRAR